MTAALSATAIESEALVGLLRVGDCGVVRLAQRAGPGGRVGRQVAVVRVLLGALGGTGLGRRIVGHREVSPGRAGGPMQPNGPQRPT